MVNFLWERRQERLPGLTFMNMFIFTDRLVSETWISSLHVRSGFIDMLPTVWSRSSFHHAADTFYSGFNVCFISETFFPYVIAYGELRTQRKWRPKKYSSQGQTRTKYIGCLNETPFCFLLEKHCLINIKILAMDGTRCWDACQFLFRLPCLCCAMLIYTA